MDALDVMKSGLRNMHGMLDTAVDGMTADQLNFRAAEGGISAFFSLWHYVRTEDNIVNFVIQHQNTVWLNGGYDERFGLPRTAQGTGMTDEQARAVAVQDVAGWLEYQRAVWAATDTYLETLGPDSMEGVQVTIKPVGEMSLWQGLWGMCLTHGFRHVGEIEFARGVQGLGGLTI
ncbi:MAG: DinB family protein [Chloroflexi bacterium]|nr:DinB family protein [Chloroflexota bacterium]MDA1147380.1 DinB family protein [Chloroflexota bacterium]